MESYPYVWAERIDTAEMSRLHKAIYGLIQFLSKFQRNFLQK